MEFVKTPGSRVLCHKDAEYKAMQFAMDKLSLGNETLRNQVRSTINKPFIFVEEYIPGFDLSRVLEDRSKLIFHPDTIKLNRADA